MKHPECRPITVSLVAEAEKRGIRITSWGIQTVNHPHLKEGASGVTWEGNWWTRGLTKEARVLVNVRAEKNIHTRGCHPSPRLCGPALNKEETLSVHGFKTRFNPSREGRIRVAAPTPCDTHYSVLLRRNT